MTLYSHFIRLEEKNNYAFYLSVFRVFVCLHLIKTIIFQWPFLDILYGPSSFLSPHNTILTELFGVHSNWIREHYQGFMMVYLLVIVLYLFGVGKNLTALALVLLLEVQQRLCPVILNGGDNLLRFVMLYMVFADSFQYFSIKTKPFKNETRRRLCNLCSNLAVLAITIHLCLVYFWSAFHKIHSDVWFNGVATYYILSLAQFKGTSFNDALTANGYFVTLSTYFTLLVEMFFPVLIWFRQTRIPALVCGLLLHIGIYIFMMIYGFEIIFIMLYGFFLTDREWFRILHKFADYLNPIIHRVNKWSRWKLPVFPEIPAGLHGETTAVFQN